MLVVRAVTEFDLDGLMALAAQVGDGMTTLKADLGMLRQRIAIASASFAGTLAPELRDYVFVMEDTDRGVLVGVCAIKSAVGLQEPFYNYRVGTLVHSSAELDVFTRMETLYLANDLTGSAELCSLFLHPDYRNGTNGKLLSKSRLLFIAQFPHLFPDRLIAELRGFLRADGTSPFWESLGRHFFQMDFNRADDLTGLGKKSFIAELMPRQPLYIALLPDDAQEAIGAVHLDTAPARRLLEQEGLFYEGYVDIFDAGPVLQARISALRALRESVSVVVERMPSLTAESGPRSDDMLLVANTSMRDFRAIVAQAAPPRNAVALPDAQLALLQCATGDRLRIMTLNPKVVSHA